MSQQNDTGFRAFAADAAIAQYLRVKFGGVQAANSVALAGAGDVAIGNLDEKPTYTAGDFCNVVLRSKPGTVKMVASGAINALAPVYGAASGKISATANGNFEGLALESASGDGSVIEVLRVHTPAQVRSQATVAAGTALTASSTETSLGAISIPAASLKAGDRIKFRAQVIATSTNSTDTLTVKAYIGGLAGTNLVSTGALDVANNDIAYIEGEIVIRTAGASGTLVATGIDTIGTAGTSTAKAFYLASTAVDTTAAQSVAISGTWSTTNAGNSCRLDILSVEVVPA